MRMNKTIYFDSEVTASNVADINNNAVHNPIHYESVYTRVTSTYAR